MAKRLRILDDYADLCSMLERWVIHQLHSVTGGLGYPKKSLDFSYITSPASSVDPTGFSAQDHRELEKAIEALIDTDPDLFYALKMHYMPWTVASMVELGHPFAPSNTYYDRLRRAHGWLSRELQRIKNSRLLDR